MATRVALLTLASVSAAVLVIAVLSFWGVNRVVAEEHRGQLQVYRRLVVDDFTARTAIVDRAIGSIASRPTTRAAGAGTGFADLRAVDSQYFLALTMYDTRGTLLARTSVDLVPPAGVISRVASATVGSTEWLWFAPDDHTAGMLWAIRAFGPPYERRAVIGLVDLDYLARALEQPASWGGAVVKLLVDADGHALASVPVDGALVPETLRMDGTGQAGSAVADVGDRTRASGTWGDVAPESGLRWRIVILETGAEPFLRVRSALVPATAGLGLLAVALVAGAFIFSRRMSDPLRQMERAARELAAGGYVRPLQVRRDDELGRVADAFNDMGVRLSSLQEMARLVASADNTDEVLDACLNALGHILGTGDAAIFLADPDEACLYLARGRGLAVPDATLTVWLDEPSPIVECYITQRLVRFGGEGPIGLDRIRELFGAGPERNGVVVPLTAGSDALGATVVMAARRPLTGAQVETLTAFNANAAMAVRTSRLFADEQRSRREAEALRAVAELTSAGPDLNAVLGSAGRIAVGLLGFESASIVMDRPEEFGLPEPGGEAATDALRILWDTVRSTGLADPDSGDPLAISGADEIRALARRPDLSWTDLVFIPLVYEGTAIGSLVLQRESDHRSPSDRDLAVARSIGQQLALAVHNAHLLREARRRAENLETVFRISQAVSSELQAGVVLNRVLDVVQKLLAADAVVLMACDEANGSVGVSMARGVVSRAMLTFRAEAGEDIAGEVVATRRPLNYGGLGHRPTPFARMAADEGHESLLAVPLLARGRATGVLIALAHKRDAFSADDMELLLTFASQAALAIDTAELYGREHNIASVLQRSILPAALPDLSGLEAASFYLPAGREAEIGGDYYDLFRSPDGGAAFVIADVCGKGVRAATKTSMVRYSIRGLIGAGLGPAAALRVLNSELYEAGDPSDIVTIWVGILDADRRSLRYASGGHPAGMVRRPDRSIDRLPATGPLLGAVEDARIEEVVVPVGTGDMVLLYTDGVTEARSGVRLFGEGRVRRALKGCKRTAPEAIETLLASVRAFCGAALRDDAAALVVRIVDDGRQR